MGFDYVLENSAAQFFPPERSRLSLFSDRGIPIEVLPARFYAGSNGARTRRNFVDKQPIFVQRQSGDVVHFAYIDEGVLSTAGFATWLAQYGELFRALRSFVVVYVAVSTAFFEPAKRRFHAAFGPRLFDMHSRPGNELVGYFRDRQLVELRDFAALGRTGMDRYRAAHQRLDTLEISALYQRWLTQGDAAFSSALPVDGEFRTYLLNHDYDLFGTVARAVAS